MAVSLLLCKMLVTGINLKMAHFCLYAVFFVVGRIGVYDFKTLIQIFLVVSMSRILGP